jgi:hypothetical protein
MIDVKMAVRLATEYLKDLYGEQAKDMRLEEVDLEDVEPVWRVTISFRANPPLPDREYKRLAISGEGVVRGMSIRTVP